MSGAPESRSYEAGFRDAKAACREELDRLVAERDMLLGKFEDIEDENEFVLRPAFARAELMHERTAKHLREERRRRRDAEYDLAAAEELLVRWLGCETGLSIERTPDHYQGDGLVTCRRAMESAQSQEKVVEPTPMALFWWLTAFKYVWRCWSKADPEADMRKAIDCLRKAMGELKSPR